MLTLPRLASPRVDREVSRKSCDSENGPLFDLLGISRLCPPQASGTSGTPNIFSCSILELKQEINLAVEFCVKHLIFLTPVKLRLREVGQ